MANMFYISSHIKILYVAEDRWHGEYETGLCLGMVPASDH